MKQMTRRLNILALLMILAACIPGMAFGQGSDGTIELPGDPQKLLEIVDQEILNKSGLSQNFSENQGYVNEYASDSVIHQYFIYDGVGTDRLISLLPAAETVRTTNKRLSFHHARRPEFHVTYSVRKSQEIPAGEGGRCWIRFSDVGVVGAGNESGIILYPGDGAYFLSPGDGGTSYEKIADLSSLDPEENVRFDFIRIAGTTYIYTDGAFRFSYTDPISTGVSFDAGAELFEGGNCIRCDFDDFSIKIN